MCSSDLTYAWYFLPFQVNLSCAIFKKFKILLYVPLFLSSWGSSRELYITCGKQGHFLPFHPVSMDYVFTTYVWYFLPFQVNLSCAIFKNSKYFLLVPLFLISWGNNREIDITCDEQGHLPPFTRCWWITSSLESTREQLKQKYKYNSQILHRAMQIWEISSNIGQWWNQGERGAYSVL